MEYSVMCAVGEAQMVMVSTGSTMDRLLGGDQAAPGDVAGKARRVVDTQLLPDHRTDTVTADDGGGQELGAVVEAQQDPVGALPKVGEAVTDANAPGIEALHAIQQRAVDIGAMHTEKWCLELLQVTAAHRGLREHFAGQPVADAGDLRLHRFCRDFLEDAEVFKAAAGVRASA
jgi:hypothetical protein